MFALCKNCGLSGHKQVSQIDDGWRVQIACETCGEVRTIHLEDDNVELVFKVPRRDGTHESK